MNDNKKQIMDKLFEVVNMVTGMDVEELDLDGDLFSFGLDSLSLMALGKQIGKKFDVDLSLEDLVTEYNTLNLMGDYLGEIVDLKALDTTPKKQEDSVEEKDQIVINEDHAVDLYAMKTVEAALEEPVEFTDRVGTNGNENLEMISQIFQRQLSVLKEQTAILNQFVGNKNGDVSLPAVPQKMVTKNGNAENLKQGNSTDKKELSYEENYYVPYKKLDTQKKAAITDEQSQYISNIEGPYVDMTRNSKDVTSQYRKIHAEWRNASGFSKLYKEFTYPIYAKSGKKSKITDIDQNEYIDIAMGFGVNLFGNNPDFVQEAIRNAMLKNGTPLGPLDQLSCSVAEKISKLTGAERVFFANTGTEADMFAVRIARAVTGKNKIVCFKGSYHGSYDGLLGISFWNANDEVSTIPMAPGITESAVNDLIMLEYDSEKSLRYIEQHADEIAAVLVEPVQSRRPDIQPKEFLQKLRSITANADIALIFDEVVLGFRIAPGGAQEYFGVQADISTYGKVLGGGLPIGVVAGSSRFLDSIDGGQWKYGDDSVPMRSAARTFVGGTFCHNHYTISAANAVLDYILENRDTMYVSLNNRTEYMVNAIQTFLAEEEVPITVSHFASMFKFYLSADEDIFYYRLIQKGIYTWEGRTCFLSTEHSEEDVEKIISAVKETIIEMKQAGFWGNQELKIEKKTESIEYPMTSIQQRLYSQIMVSEQDPFDMVGVFGVQGTIDEERLEHAMNQVIEKNDVLRTSLYTNDGQFLQKISETQTIKIRNIVQDEPLELNAYINKILCKFQLDESPLLEVILLTTLEGKKVLVFHIHHAVSDGISIEIIVRELLLVYGGNEPSELRPYHEFLQWEEDYLYSEKLEADREFWKQEMEDVTCYIPISHSKNKGIETNREGKVLYEFIEKETADRLKQLAKECGVSMFMLMLGVMDLLLHKLTDEKSIAVAISASLRFVSGFEDAMGMYANNIALKSIYQDKATFKEYVNELKKTTVQSFSHSCYPYNLLIKQVQEHGEDEFNISFSYENADQRTPIMNDVYFQPVSFMPDTQDYEITFDLQEKNDGIEINFSYMKDLYDERDMKYLLERFLYITNQIIDKKAFQLEEIEILLEDEKEQVLYQFNDTKMQLDKMETVVSLFEKQVEKTPDDVALWDNERKYTYRELNEKANQVAWHLKEAGVGANDAVCVMAQRSAETIICIHGILKAGAAYMPIDPRYPEERILFMIEDCQPKLILVGDMQVPSEVDVPSLSIWDESLYEGKCENLGVEISGDSIVHYMYTSGTTGKPKGVLSTHVGLLNRIMWHQSQYPMKRGDAILQKTTYTFDDSVYEILWSTLVGGKLCLLEEGAEMDVEKMYRAIVNYGITQILFVPTVLRELLRYVKEKGQKEAIANLRLVVSSGESLTPDLVALFKEVLGDTECVLANLYGPTEASIDVTYYDCKLNETDSIPIGKPIGNTSIYILRDMKLCGIGMPGELCIGGIGVAKGYLNRLELTAEKFIPNPYAEGLLYRTGDVAYWDQEGNVRYCGRRDKQVKIRGQRVELGEIEENIRKLQYVQDAVVIARKDENHVGSIYAYFTANTVLDMKQVREALSVNLPNYMIPQYMMQIEEIPLTNNGKVKKQALPEIKGQSFIEYVEPENEIQEALCKVFQEVLGVERVGIQDGFFALGGDSIRAIKVVSKLRDLGYELSVRDIFTKETVEALAVVVRFLNGEDNAEGEIMPVPMVEKFDSYGISKPHNRTVMIPVGETNYEIATQAFQKLLEFHDMLRATYQDSILTVLGKDSVSVELKQVDLRNEADTYTAVKKECSEMQQNFDMENGLLVNGIFFQMDAGNYVMLFVNQFVADEYSLVILKEDFESAIESLENNGVQELVEKTASYKSFSISFNEYINGSAFEADKKQWELSKEKILLGKLQAVTLNSMNAKTGRINFNLSMNDTNSLLQSAGMAFNTNVSELIVVALSKACSKLTGQMQVAIDMLDAGRDSFVGLNLKRTVGWFVCPYPVCVEMREPLSDMIIQTKEMIRKLPEVKVGAKVVCDEVSSDILLDCLSLELSGSNRIQTDSQFGYSTTEEKDTAYALEIKCSLQNQMLNVNILFDDASLEEGKVASLKKNFEEELLEVIHFCINQEEQIKTVSDYGNEDMEDDELNEILGMFD